jgi:deoxyribonuclease-4
MNRTSTKSPILGAHMSAAGGPYKAIDRAAEVGAECCQIFTHAPSQWAVKPTTGSDKHDVRWKAAPLADDSVEKLQQAMKKHQMRHLIAHSSYLINLASPDLQLWKKSIDAFVVELQRADELSIPYVVLHPGAHTTSSESAGLKRVVRALNQVHRRTKGLTASCLLENTAGQGTCLGWRFEHLAEIIQQVKQPERLGICFDTCHALAAGYALGTRRQYRQTMRELTQLVGLERIKAIHLNDSKRELGSRVDRHEHIGRGHVGIEAFARLLNDRRLQRIPMYLETPKGDDPKTGKPWDIINLRRLRRLVGRPPD